MTNARHPTAPTDGGTVDPNAESDTDEARGVMNRIVTSGVGAIAAVLVVLLIVVWLVGLRG